MSELKDEGEVLGLSWGYVNGVGVVARQSPKPFRRCQSWHPLFRFSLGTRLLRQLPHNAKTTHLCLLFLSFPLLPCPRCPSPVTHVRPPRISWGCAVHGLFSSSAGMPVHTIPCYKDLWHLLARPSNATDNTSPATLRRNNDGTGWDQLGHKDHQPQGAIRTRVLFELGSIRKLVFISEHCSVLEGDRATLE